MANPQVKSFGSLLDERAVISFENEVKFPEGEYVNEGELSLHAELQSLVNLDVGRTYLGNIIWSMTLVIYFLRMSPV